MCRNVFLNCLEILKFLSTGDTGVDRPVELVQHGLGTFKPAEAGEQHRV
jgi:hypothetical protein